MKTNREAGRCLKSVQATDCGLKRPVRQDGVIFGSMAAIGLALLCGSLAPAVAEDTPTKASSDSRTHPTKPDYSPYPEQRFPDRVLWGVAHVHTGYSFDAGMFGVTLTPDDLFRVSSGGEVVLDNGQRYKQDRPLDWVSITDHAEYLGIADQIRAGSPELLENPQGKRWYEMSQKSPEEGVKAAIEAVVSMQTGTPVFKSDKLAAAAWAHATEAAEKWNHPGVFTTLHGFEWTSAPGGNNLHRTVIFRDNAERVNQVLPFSTFDSSDPAQLWKYMDAYAKKTGGQVLAIPHNGNLSNGMMYSAKTFDGKPMDRAYAEARASHEPLLEATQIKGDGETTPYLSPNDEFADFERWNVDFGKMAPARDSVLHANYARSALKLGLELEAKLGANPYQAGMIGGNDAHVGVVTTREDNFFGEFANGLPSPERWKTPLAMIETIRRRGRWSRSGTNPLRASVACGRARTHARRSGTRSSAGKSMPPPATGRSCACSPAGTSCRQTSTALTSLRTDTRTGCRWAAISPRPRPASGQPFWCTRCVTPTVPTSTAYRSSRAGSARTARAQERIFDVAVSGGRKIGPDGRCRTAVGSPSTWRTRATRTPSALRRCRRSGRTRRSTRRSERSTTCV